MSRILATMCDIVEKRFFIPVICRTRCIAEAMSRMGMSVVWTDAHFALTGDWTVVNPREAEVTLLTRA
jgi:hypothetical protein